MDASGLLTVLAVLLAGAALLPERTRLDLKIRITKIDILIFSLLGITCIYLLFLDVLKANSASLPLPWILGFDKKSSLLLASLILIVSIITKLKSSNLPKSSVPLLEKTIEQLLKDGSFKDISYLISKYEGQLTGYIRHRPWYIKLHEKIKPESNYVFLNNLNRSKSSKAKNIFLSLREKIAHAMKSRTAVADNSKRILVSIFKSRPLAKYLAHNYPTIGLKLLSTDLNIDSLHREEFITFLIEDLHGPFYRELSQCQYLLSSDCYEIASSNSILTYLFSDIHILQDLEVYVPIEKYIINFIKNENTEISKYHNKGSDYTFSNENLTCPIYMTILFFNLMIREAIDKKSKNHLFPHYIGQISKEIFNNINHDKADLNVEFPTRNDYLLYECFLATSQWLSMIVSRVNDGSKEKYDPYLIIELLGMMLYTVIKSNKFKIKMKAYYFGIVLRTIKFLDESKLKEYSKKIAKISISKFEYQEPEHELIKIVHEMKPFIQVDDFTLIPIICEYYPRNTLN